MNERQKRFADEYIISGNATHQLLKLDIVKGRLIVLESAC